MADASLHLDTKEFEKYLKDHKRELILIDFYADWCPHCRAVGPVLENLARLYKKDGLTVIKIDTDKEEKLAVDWKVEYLPTMILQRDGKELERESGSKSPEFLDAMVKKHLKE